MSFCDTRKHENDPSPALLRRGPSPRKRGEGGEQSEPGEGAQSKFSEQPKAAKNLVSVVSS